LQHIGGAGSDHGGRTGTDSVGVALMPVPRRAGVSPCRSPHRGPRWPRSPG
jgi:hypothetical protein